MVTSSCHLTDKLVDCCRVSKNPIHICISVLGTQPPITTALGGQNIIMIARCFKCLDHVLNYINFNIEQPITDPCRYSIYFNNMLKLFSCFSILTSYIAKVKIESISLISSFVLGNNSSGSSGYMPLLLYH